MNHYTTFRRLESEIISLARSRGLNGTPFLRDDPPLGSREQEMAALWLSLDVPRPLSDAQKRLIRRWARNIVMSSRSIPPQSEERNGTKSFQSTKPVSAIDRANRLAASHRTKRRPSR